MHSDDSCIRIALVDTTVLESTAEIVIIVKYDAHSFSHGPYRDAESQERFDACNNSRIANAQLGGSLSSTTRLDVEAE